MSYGQYSYNTFEPRSREDNAHLRNPDGSVGKRVKRVMRIEQVIHVWAQRTQTNGESNKGNVYFEGDRLFDYGTHFCMGQFITNKKGALAVFLNSNEYGPTTSHHKNITAGAVRHYEPNVFTIPGAGYGRDYNTNIVDAPKILANYVERAQVFALKAKRAKKPYSIQWNTRRAQSLIDEAAAFAAFFGHRWKKPELAGLAELAAKHAKEAAKEEKRRADAAKAEAAQQFSEWQSGVRRYCPAPYACTPSGGAYIRVVGDTLETSQGAEVPLSHAIRAFKFIKLCKERSNEWHTNGHSLRVGHFTATKIDASGNLTIGCHYIEWAEIERIAKAIGVFDQAASKEALEANAHA